jgi:hypothetical protein
MKRTVFLLLAMTIGAGLTAQTAASPAPSRVEISFVYTRQSGAASNQFALWIEDAGGTLVKTLYATRYTANGGWKVRSQSIPQWVQKSHISSMSAAQIDAFTSATPRAGTLTYIWDGTDSRGAKVPAGEYRVFLEASLRWGNRVVYSASVSGTDTNAPVIVRYYDENAELADAKVPNERSMIGSVKVTVQK